jgi:uncharacterized membrane protein YgcG
MNTYRITENVYPLADEIKIGDQIELTDQLQEVVACEETGVKMLNIDADQLRPGDLSFIKKIGLTISNPDTDKPVALGVDYLDESWGKKVHDYLTSDSDDSDDDSSFFSAGAFLGGLGHSGFSSVSGGGFGGFGGGSFSGGGASASF